jgi:hypothetical protein
MMKETEMTDIVEQLQREADLMYSGYGLLYDAAEEIVRLREAHNRSELALEKALARLSEVEQLNAKAAKVITQYHSALSILALGRVGSHIAVRALRNIEEGLTE